MSISANVETITPDMASVYLKCNTTNRSVNAARVKQYAAIMKSGAWMLNGEALVFSKEGRLLNGQHRLSAVIAANVSVPFLVVRNAAPESFSTFDTGRNRSIQDVLTIEGLKNAKTLGTAARSFYMVENKSIDAKDASNEVLRRVVEQNPQISYWTDLFCSKRSKMPSQMVGVIAAMHKYHGHETAETFFEKAALGIQLSNNEPEYLLRERFIGSSSYGKVITQRIKLAFIIKAANGRITGKYPKYLRLTADEATPVLCGL